MYTAKTILFSLLIFNAKCLLGCEKTTGLADTNTIISTTKTPSLVARTAAAIKAATPVDTIELDNWFPSQTSTSSSWPQRVTRSPYHAVTYGPYNRSPFSFYR